MNVITTFEEITRLLFELRLIFSYPNTTEMSSRRFYISIVLFVMILTAYSCGNNPKPEANKENEKLKETLSVPEPSEDTNTNTISEDTTVIQEATKQNKTPDGPPPNYSSLPGPVGFVKEDNLIMRDKPDVKSNKIASLKMQETIYILETSMIGEGGSQTQYPTWYKIERKNKERGWVKASAVSSGH